MARTLRNCGVQADTLVAILADRSLEMIVSIIAIWKAGALMCPWTLNIQKSGFNICFMMRIQMFSLFSVI
ncbi:AMP-binding protein [Bacillus inaquosorum]|nr:AMP-binding protein [Bacillus inaquosorum]